MIDTGWHFNSRRPCIENQPICRIPINHAVTDYNDAITITYSNNIWYRGRIRIVHFYNFFNTSMKAVFNWILSYTLILSLLFDHNILHSFPAFHKLYLSWHTVDLFITFQSAIPITLPSVFFFFTILIHLINLLHFSVQFIYHFLGFHLPFPQVVFSDTYSSYHTILQSFFSSPHSLFFLLSSNTVWHHMAVTLLSLYFQHIQPASYSSTHLTPSYIINFQHLWHAPHAFLLNET